MDIPQERKLVTEVPGPKSLALFERRAAAIPPGVANIHPIVTARASGAIVEDVDGNRLIDLATGISVLNVGHTAPEVVAAAQRQLELDTHSCFHVTANEPYIELAERLNALVPIDGPVKTMFANSGAEAVENAVKIARKATDRSAVVAFDHAFHGRTLMGMFYICTTYRTRTSGHKEFTIQTYTFIFIENNIGIERFVINDGT